MEERVPLEKPSLTHTSTEPEAQAWAQIGTVSQQAEKQPSDSTETEAQASKLDRDDDAASDVQLHVDEELHDRDDTEDLEPRRKDENGEEEGDQEKSSGEGRKGSSSPRRSSKSPPRGRRRRSRSIDSDGRDMGSSTLTNSGNYRLIRARVFVGHLNTDKVSRKDVEKLFSSCGNIVGVSLQQGYGFVQFENEENARKAIRELHGIQYHNMRLVVDKPVALKKMLGEDPHAPAPYPGSREPRDRECLEELRRRDLFDRYARIEELERYYYDRYPPPLPRRDPYYDRFMDRYPPPPIPDRFYDRYRLAELERERYYDRLPPLGGPPDPASPAVPFGYDRPRDDPFDRRERERDREPFEKFERREAYDRRQPFERYGLPRRP